MEGEAAPLSITRGASLANGAAVKRNSDVGAATGAKVARFLRGRSPLFSPPQDLEDADGKGWRQRETGTLAGRGRGEGEGMRLMENLHGVRPETALQRPRSHTDTGAQRYIGGGLHAELMPAERDRERERQPAAAEEASAEAVRDEINLVDSDEETEREAARDRERDSCSSSEDEASLFESPQSKRRRNRQRDRGAIDRGHDRPRLQKPLDITLALSATQQACLEQIERREDRHLLRLFWAHGWRAPAADTDLNMSTAKCFVFLKHQFLALRFVAGAVRLLAADRRCFHLLNDRRCIAACSMARCAC